MCSIFTIIDMSSLPLASVPWGLVEIKIWNVAEIVRSSQALRLAKWLLCE